MIKQESYMLSITNIAGISRGSGILACDGEVHLHHLCAGTEPRAAAWKGGKWRSKVVKGLKFMVEDGGWCED